MNVSLVVNANGDWAKLREENVAFKQSIRQYKLQDEMVQPSRNDELAHELIKFDIKVKEARYEIPVPFKSEKLQTLSIITRTASIEPCHCIKPRCVILSYNKHLWTPFLR